MPPKLSSIAESDRVMPAAKRSVAFFLFAKSFITQFGTAIPNSFAKTVV
jgi:hypothetical protein